MGRRRIERKVITCDCGCGQTKEVKHSNPKARFINRSHYAVWLKDNPIANFKPKPKAPLPPLYTHNFKKEARVIVQTGKFPLFL